jgi:hypothetical protein
MMQAASRRGHNRRRALIPARLVEAFANSRAITAAISGKRRGSTTVCCGGQTDPHHGGHRVGLDKLDLQMVVVDGATGQRGNFGHWDSLPCQVGSRPGRCLRHRSGHLHGQDHLLVRLSSVTHWELVGNDR